MRSLPDIFRTGYISPAEGVVEIPDFPWPKEKKHLSTPDVNGFREYLPEDDEPEKNNIPEKAPPPPPPPPRELTLPEIEERYKDELTQLRRKAMQTGIQDAQIQVQQQAQEAAEQAYQDAYARVLEEKAAVMQEAIDDVSEKLNELQLQHTQYMEQYAESLKYMAIEIAEKIMYLRLEEDDKALEKLVMQTLSSIKHAEWISVDISNKLVSLVDFMREELKKAKYEDKAELKVIDAPADTCRISTESGTVDASISTQLENLKEAFENAERS